MSGIRDTELKWAEKGARFEIGKKSKGVNKTGMIVINGEGMWTEGVTGMELDEEERTGMGWEDDMTTK